MKEEVAMSSLNMNQLGYSKLVVEVLLLLPLPFLQQAYTSDIK
jgi:hypothetical protein